MAKIRLSGGPSPPAISPASPLLLQEISRERFPCALFVAAGPPLRRGLVVKPFENIHIYDLLCAVLRLAPAPNDGDPAATRAFLR